MTALTLFLDGVLFLFGLTSVLILGRLTRTGGGRGLLFAAAGLVVLSVVHVLETVLGLWGFVGEGPPEIVHRLLVLVAFAWLAFGLRGAGRGIWAHQEQLRATNVRLHEEVEERGRAEAEATFLAYHDRLTGLPNRAAFKRALEAASSDPSKRLFAVFFVDLDSFKLVNDTAGHSAGDEVLITAGERIRLALRPSDFFARTGGDEFTILTGELTEPADALTLANAVVFAMRRPITVGRDQFHVHASIGIAYFPDDGGDAETLLQSADAAMYLAKDAGRDMVQVYPADHRSVLTARLRLETELRRGIAEGQFVLHYQPQVTTGSGQVVGFEALVRWNHPERGLLAPAEFIQIAEATGLIVPLGNWVIGEACRQASDWEARGLLDGRHISVNVSARQFQSGEVVSVLASALSDTGLAGAHLWVEITEATAVQDLKATSAILLQIQELGVRISIDDFGTGYCSLQYLTGLPVHELKIDQSFVAGLNWSEADAAVTGAIIGLARSLNLTVTAEGVESEQQLAFLRERDCPTVQGYLLSRPLKADAAADFLGGRTDAWAESMEAVARAA